MSRHIPTFLFLLLSLAASAQKVGVVLSGGAAKGVGTAENPSADSGFDQGSVAGAVVGDVGSEGVGTCVGAAEGEGR